MVVNKNLLVNMDFLGKLMYIKEHPMTIYLI